jgi:hypothetical protein
MAQDATLIGVAPPVSVPARSERQLLARKLSPKLQEAASLAPEKMGSVSLAGDAAQDCKLATDLVA